MTEVYKFLQLDSPYLLLPSALLGILLIMVSRIYTEILIYYLKNNKSALWKELSETSGPILYGSKTFIRFRYIFGTEDDDDRRILRLKIKIRNFLKIGLFLFIGVPLLFAFLFFICVLSGQR